MNALSATVNQIESCVCNSLRSARKLGTDDAAKPMRKAADDLGEQLATTEGTLLQLKLTGRGQDDCRWAPMLLQKVEYLFSQLDSNADFPQPLNKTAVQQEFKAAGRQSHGGLSTVCRERPGGIQRHAPRA